MQLQNLFSTLFRHSWDDAANRVVLQDTVKKYPYFSTAAFYLLKKTESGTGYYNKLAARTAMHFESPHLLHFRLKEADTAIPAEQPVVVESTVLPIANPVEVETVDTHQELPVTSVGEVETVATVHPAKEDVPLFEPLFATDYFASQGIRLSEEVQPGDKLGKQLKSFTEWLKSMKKVHDGKLPAGNEPVDVAVQNLAEKSNQEGEVVTESMADAYMQQGKLKKAREVYEKLSLLNPAKSAYFAAKIEQTGV